MYRATNLMHSSSSEIEKCFDFNVYNLSKLYLSMHFNSFLCIEIEKIVVDDGFGRNYCYNLPSEAVVMRHSVNFYVGNISGTQFLSLHIRLVEFIAENF